MSRKIFISIATALLIILFCGIWLQTFLPVGTRPTDWFAKEPVEDMDNGHSEDFPIIYD